MKHLWISYILLALLSPVNGQHAPLAMPAWLKPYPGAKAPTASTSPELIESSYTVAAQPDQVIAYYKNLLEVAGLPFNPNFDGTGTSIRAAAAECDLLIRVRDQNDGSVARVSCAAKSTGSLSGADVTNSTASPRTDSAGRGHSSEEAEQFRTAPRKAMEDDCAALQAALQRRSSNRGTGKYVEPAWPHAPENDAPPLIWPSWLVDTRGRGLHPMEGVDRGERYLESRFVSGGSMTTIYKTYEELLNANGFHVCNARLGTKQQISGIVQNTAAYLEGDHFLYDSTGPRIVIFVLLSHLNLNEPIDVQIRVTALPRF